MDAVKTLRDNLVSVIINPLMALLFAAALVVFIWGVVQFLWGLNTEATSKEEGKKHMLWGIIGMFIMTVAWALLQLVGNTVGAPVR